jgi:hypothetical protein
MKWDNDRETRMSDANLSGALFYRSAVGNTSFDDIDLSKAQSLEDVIHYGPSSVGIDTLYKSKGKIAEEIVNLPLPKSERTEPTFTL